MTDTRSVFLNIDQLAAVTDELATAFRGAMGEEEETSPGVASREGEGGTDRLGEVFISLVSDPGRRLLTSASPPSTSVRLLLRSTEYCFR